MATYEKVHAFQAGLKITPLSAWGSEPPEVTGTFDPSVDNTTEPLRQVFALDAATFFGYASELLQQHAPHFQDYPVLDRLARIGFHVGETFDLSQADPVVQSALAKAVPAAQQKITDRQKRLGWAVNGWQTMTENIGNYGTDYLQRACVELIAVLCAGHRCGPLPAGCRRFYLPSHLDSPVVICTSGTDRVFSGLSGGSRRRRTTR